MNDVKLMIRKFGLLFCLMMPLASHSAEPLEAVQLYTQDELLVLINKNTHLERVKADDCQLVQDIEARAIKMSIPAYQFLFGDMLAYGVCLDRDVERGMYFIRLAAEQGLAEALEQMGRYYHLGKFVQVDIPQAIVFLREAAALGNLKAQIRLVDLFNKGEGSPADYEDAYRWLFHSIIAETKTHKEVETLLATLAKKMPPSVIERARKPI
ncbi:hypothetical protein PTUN_a0699 [Pseudoalteromonas tunicata]|jgi:hypothetical protein|uniref:Sodium-type polar flagellar protein motX n=2 Tax=Pseudoalteromonas tunicata TaxID=314281 RepID=A4C8N5_9GAMM|nr:hypothetical protein PTUN_a0699 [Pseudoalteromonas tunicata]AXT32495.1 sel1 repeat family protein [Pseudoalteromonas tunicata]EAR28950.1 Sodium-type polar flagellar protein motX [Pseudoalteromonas tunicata D2]